MDNDQHHPDEPVHHMDTPWTLQPGWGTPLGVLNQPAPFAPVTEPWTPGTPTASGWGAYSAGGLPYPPSASPAPPRPRVREDGWAASGIGRVSATGRMLNLDVVALIILFLLPAANEVPVHSRGHIYLAPAYVRRLTRVMCLSRAWYSTVLRTCEVWGILLASTWHSSVWNMVRHRAKSAPLRLFYLNKFHWPDLDALLDRASAVYADAHSRWRNWTHYLEGRRMPFLEALYLRPDRDRAPATPLPSCASPLDAPRVRHVELSSPLVLKAPMIESAVLYNFSVEQLIEFFAALPTIRHVELHKTAFVDGIDWTGLFVQAGSHVPLDTHSDAGHWDSLEVLRIWCRRGDSYPLASDAIPVGAPALTTLDLAGPMLLTAPNAKNARLQHICVPDLHRMLQGMPAIVELTVVSLRGQTLYDFNAGCQPILLPQLRQLTLTTGVKQDTLEFLQGIRADMVSELSFTCDASAPPNYPALQHVANLLAAALPGDLPAVRAALDEARNVLWSAQYPGISAVLNAEVSVAYWWNGEVLAPMPNVLGILRHAATVVRDMALATHDEGPPLHAGHRVRELALAALRTMGLDEHTMAPVRLSTRVHSGSVHFDAKVGTLRDGTARLLRCAMVSPTFNASGIESAAPHMEPLDSVAYGSARILYGLSAMPVAELFVSTRGHGPFRSLDRSHQDIFELARSLERYPFVKTLVMEIGGDFVESGLLRAISSPASLPALERLSILSPQSDDEQTTHPPSFASWWDELEAALRRRKEAGASPPALSVSGRFCLSRKWRESFASIAGGLSVSVTCESRVRGECVHRFPARPLW